MASDKEKLDKVYDTALEAAYSNALEPAATYNALPDEMLECLGVISSYGESYKAVLAIFTTLMLKKAVSPKQDIRYHQSGMSGGFSARGLDEKIVTPFLKKHGFPYMTSGSGALTRSLEQAVPFNAEYTGSIRSKKLKEVFLAGIDLVQNKNLSPHDTLTYLLTNLIKYRDTDKSMKLVKPKELSIKTIITKISHHIQSAKTGASRLPVLAIYAVYEQLIKEVNRYKGCSLCPLEEHNASDSKTGKLGDIQVNDSDNNPFEVVEIKHGIELKLELVNACYEKIKNERVKTFYLLSTNERITDERISEKLMNIYEINGCQMIVNGIETTLKYYLRLLKNTNEFLYSYVELLEKKCNYETKRKWNELFPD